MAVKLFKPKAGSIAAFNKDGIAIKDIKNIEGTDAILVTYKDNSQKIFENYNYFINHIGYKEAYNPKTFESVNTLIESTDINVGDIVYYKNDFIIVDEELKNKLEALTVSSTDGVLDPFNDGSCKIYYPFNGTMKDLAGLKNTLPAPVEYVEGGAKLNGTSLNYAINDISDVINPSNDGGAISVKIKILDASSTYPMILSTNSWDGKGFFIGKYVNNNINAWIKSVNLSDFSISVNEWIHLTLNFDFANNKVYIYLNGNVVSTGSSNNKIDFGKTSYALGLCNRLTADSTSLDTNFKTGSSVTVFKNLRIFNRSLTDNEIQTLAKEQGTVKKSVKKLAL